jgi:ribosomal protein S18 acetylase RimI-like enzyme
VSHSKAPGLHASTYREGAKLTKLYLIPCSPPDFHNNLNQIYNPIMSSSNFVTIRPRDPSDIPILTQILTEVYNLTKYPVDGLPSFPARFQSTKALASIVALYNGKIVGHAELQDASGLNSQVIDSLTPHAPLSSFAALVSLFVDPKIQGKGVGARLVREALVRGKAEGKRLVLIVLDKDEAAIRMYEKMGWERGIEYMYETGAGVKYKAFSYVAPI